MNKTVMRAGWSRGVTELRQSFTNGGDLFNHFFWPVLMLVVLFLMRDVSFGDGEFELGTLVLPGILGMNAAMAMVTMSQLLTADREDGTLLRAKATPHGTPAYLVGKIISVSVGVVVDLTIFLVPALFIIPDMRVGSSEAWLTLGWVLVLGLVATLPIGAVLGSLFSSTRSQGLLTLPIMAMIGISGIFYPVTSMPEWVQGLAQVFPVYWLGLGMRSALLPDSAVTVEIGDAWRHLETVGVLSVWAVVGLVLAPIVLRRMARRESGSTMAERREKALQRVG
ncbi:ABC transporter permease [Streptomyces sp. RTd22]|uniref:ABC transporter permease n=1 Tax=Streptomyces sp. RTd22 TaxID=1841249 RepID=UPI0007C47287|nr:ABC transporter permease [Streptomyces sp. RTd22]